MRNNLQSVLNIISEKTYENKKNLSEKDKQRRNQVVDLFGIDISRQSKPSRHASGKDEATLYVSVSSDLVYYERFQFKIYIEDTTAQNFQIIARANVESSTGDYEPQEIDLTPYLKAQQDGEWIDGENWDNQNYNMAWPNNSDVVQATPEEPPNAYDILDVASTMYAEGKNEEADALLRPGLKQFFVRAESGFYAAMILYLKYSHLNR